MTQQPDHAGGNQAPQIVWAEAPGSLLDRLLEELKDLTSILPNLLGAIAVFFIGWLLSKMIARVVKRVLSKVGIDKLAERLNEIEIVYKSNIKIVPSILISKILYYLLMLVVIMAATDVLKMEAVSKLVNDLINYIPSLLMAMLVLAVGILVADAVKNAVQTACNSLAIPAGKVISSVVFYFLFINVLMMALSQAKLETGFIESNISIVLAGVVGAFAIGYGYASRNIVAGLLTSFYHKERVQPGDYIRIDGVEGQIIAIESTSLTIKTEAGREVIVPLHKLSSETWEIISRKKDQ